MSYVEQYKQRMEGGGGGKQTSTTTTQLEEGKNAPPMPSKTSFTCSFRASKPSFLSLRTRL